MKTRHNRLAGFLSIALISALFTSAVSLPVSAQEKPEDLISRATSLYALGNYEEAELVALRALTNAPNIPEVDRARLYRLLGFIYVAQDEKEKAKLQFIKWLELDPFAKLDPVYISPKIISVFEAARAEFESQRKRGKPQDYAQLSQQLKALRRSVLFPGLGQLYLNKQVKGYTLLTAEIICIGGFAYFQVNYNRSRDNYLQEINPSHMQSLYDDYNFFYRGKNASLILAAGIYLYSLVDVLYFPPAPSASQKVSLSILPQPESLIRLTFTFP